MSLTSSNSLYQVQQDAIERGFTATNRTLGFSWQGQKIQSTLRRSKECCCQSLLPKKFTKGAAWIVADITTTWRGWVHRQIAASKNNCTVLLIDIGRHAEVTKTYKDYQQINSLYLSLHIYIVYNIYILLYIYTHIHTIIYIYIYIYNNIYMC